MKKILLALILLSPEGPELPREVLLSDTPIPDHSLTSRPHIRAWFFPKRAEPAIGNRVGEIDVFGTLAFEVVNGGGRRLKLTRLEDILPDREPEWPQPARFTPLFQDLNGDSRPDFTFCDPQRFMSDCRVFTVKRDGAVVLLPMADGHSGFATPNVEWSATGLEPASHGFCVERLRLNDTERREFNCFEWNPESREFELRLR